MVFQWMRFKWVVAFPFALFGWWGGAVGAVPPAPHLGRRKFMCVEHLPLKTHTGPGRGGRRGRTSAQNSDADTCLPSPLQLAGRSCLETQTCLWIISTTCLPSQNTLHTFAWPHHRLPLPLYSTLLKRHPTCLTHFSFLR